MTKEQEINNAFSVLEKHGVCYMAIPTNDLKGEFYADLFEKHKVKPTDENIKKIEAKAIDYLGCESIKLIEDAIEYVAMRNSFQSNKK